MMQKKQLFKWKKLWNVGLVVAPMLLAACSQAESNEIIFANYQSYMSPWLENNLSDKYNVSFDYFNVAEDVPSRYKIRAYDSSVVSTSVMQNMIGANTGLNQQSLVQKIDWSKFHIKDKSGKAIQTAEEAVGLFTAPVQKILKDTYKDSSGKQINLLEYGIPYFLQTFNFAYRGEPIEALKNSVSWADMLQIIGKNPRFQAQTNSPKIAMVEDPRTLLSVSQIMQTHTGVNPDPSKTSIADLTASYNQFVNNGINRQNLRKNPVLLNSDSNVIINKLASKPGTISSSIGAFMYNGDVLYASNGGDAATEIPDNDFHIVTNDQTLYALDMINISSFVTDPSKLDRMYKMIRSIALEGVNDDEGILSESVADPSVLENSTAKSIAESLTSGHCNTENCYSYDINLNDGDLADDASSYKYGPAINFDSVQYTPVLKKLYDALLGVTGDKTDPTYADAEATIEDSYFYEAPEHVFFGKKSDASISLDYSLATADNWTDYFSAANLPSNEDEAADDANENTETTENGEASGDVATDASESSTTTEAKANHTDAAPKASTEANSTETAETQTEDPKSKITVTEVHYDRSENTVTITYENLVDPDSEAVTVTADLSETAETSYNAAKNKAMSKAKLQTKIMMINAREHMINYVEQKLSDLGRSNMTIAFNELKNQW